MGRELVSLVGRHAEHLLAEALGLIDRHLDFDLSSGGRLTAVGDLNGEAHVVLGVLSPDSGERPGKSEAGDLRQPTAPVRYAWARPSGPVDVRLGHKSKEADFFNGVGLLADCKDALEGFLGNQVPGGVVAEPGEVIPAGGGHWMPWVVVTGSPLTSAGLIFTAVAGVPLSDSPEVRVL
ncbi:hypothetical protein [Streptomyces tubercidicus]|uniref:hypothetical protein n=1 Tax=Streptomyces tubercidicus TaxID=47759 RepID=UPI0034663A71